MTDPWLRRFHRSPGARVRLVCFPHAGGSASFYFQLSASLTPDIEVAAVQYPGRQDRRTEPPIPRISTLADEVAGALPTSGTPFAFFGHSMGAVVAYEVARRLRRDGRPMPAHLFASGRRAPSRVRDESVHRRDDDGILAEISALGGTDGAVLENEELIRMAMPAIRGDYAAIETYAHTPGRVLDLPMTVLVGEDDPRTTLDEASAWAEHTTAAANVKIYPGGHFYLVPLLGEVTTLVRETLAPPHVKH